MQRRSRALAKWTSWIVLATIALFVVIAVVTILITLMTGSSAGSGILQTIASPVPR